MDSDLDFFSFATDDTKTLQLPPGCGRRMQGLSENILLRDRYKNVWAVKMVNSGGNWYFEKGWNTFYKDNSLEPLDSLIFAYKGDNLFDFKLIGMNGCEKKGKGCNLIDPEEEMDVEGNEEEDKDGEEEIDVEGGEEEEKDEEDMQYVFESDDDYVQEEADGSDEEYVRVLAEYQDEEAEQANIARKYVKLNSKRKACSAAGSSSSRLDTTTVENIPRGRSCKKKNVPGCYGDDIFRLGLMPRPKNPYFVSRSRPMSRPYELYIPNEVINNYNLSIPEKFFLVDEKGLKWGTKTRRCGDGDGRLRCVQGWNSLCITNRIDRDDVCVCEFVKGKEQKDFCIKVTALRK